MTVEANPETVDDELAAALAGRGVRVSLGAQSFGHAQLAVLERRATPERVREAVGPAAGGGRRRTSRSTCSSACPGMGRAELDRDIDEALALAPEHLSCYELEAKPGTRFTHRHGAELARQAELLEDHYEHVIARLGAAGYRWYETANFCRDDRRAQHNLAYWTGRDYLGIGIGAVSTLGLERRTNRPSLAGFIDALERGRGAAALARAADGRGARPRAPAARAAARRAARGRRARARDRPGRARAHGLARADRAG